MSSASKMPRKRPAVSQAGPKHKKAHVDKPSVTDKGKKRSQPVTLPLKDDSATSSEDEFEGEELEEEQFDEFDAEIGGDDANSRPNPKDPNATRESHRAQRALLEQRRAAKPYSALLTQAKDAWTLARQKNLKKQVRTKHIHALMDIIRGQVKDIVFKHDASRIVQTAVKHGGQSERNEIAEELKGRYKELAQNKYSKFLVTKLIRLCPAHRATILREFQGHILRMLLHREASSVLADAFELHANAYERSLLLRDFYGKEANLFTVTAGSDEEKERSKKGLPGLLENLEEDRRKRVLTALKDNLVTIFNNPDKGAVAHAIVHRALWEYLAAINGLKDTDEQEKLRREIFESCQDVLAEMVHTKDGSRVVREFIVQGTAKDRKHIVKTIKPHVDRMCKDDEAQLVLFTAFDVIDDTKLTAKSLVSDIVASAPSLYTSSQGRRSLIYLVAPRTRRHFTPAQIALLAETDSVRARTSKKDDTVRSAEIRRAASDGLLAWIANSGAEVSRDPGGSLVISEIMLEAEGDKSAASDTLLKALSTQYPSQDPAAPHPISLPHTSRIYKTLLQGGHFSRTTSAIEPAPHFSSSAFAARFVQLVGRETTIAMAKGDGAFVISALCEQLMKEEAEETSVIRSWFDEDTLKEMDKTTKGASLLLEMIQRLRVAA
ncbi:Pumilio y domain family member 6 [Grifola frondosa]|uniref:Pumilio y domain family member 6 n=1 Tax=Grifola frondosa TaxID=5627 RepID=A0A1C7MM23_GRIFR|nr:Pumilio y domain family member 6 [Grifola frondosa]